MIQTPEIIALEQQGMEPLTQKEFKDWAFRSGNPCTSSKARVQDSFTEKKISDWLINDKEVLCCSKW
jgi:hypothetical protein